MVKRPQQIDPWAIPEAEFIAVATNPFKTQEMWLRAQENKLSGDTLHTLRCVKLYNGYLERRIAVLKDREC
jgi:hypothetical protein